jgi:plastocyanin
VTATEAPAGSVEIEMVGPPPRFIPAAVTVPAGDIVFFLKNDSPARDPHGIHTLAIGRTQGQPLVVSDEVQGGRRAIFTVHGLEPGAYTMWCTFPGHAGLGQVATLTVE